MTLTIKLDGNWSSFQLANSTPPLSVTDSAIAPSARMHPLDQLHLSSRFRHRPSQAPGTPHPLEGNSAAAARPELQPPLPLHISPSHPPSTQAERGSSPSPICPALRAKSPTRRRVQPSTTHAGAVAGGAAGVLVGVVTPLKNTGSHIDASHSRQPLVKGERLVRYEVNAVMPEHRAGQNKGAATRSGGGGWKQPSGSPPRASTHDHQSRRPPAVDRGGRWMPRRHVATRVAHASPDRGKIQFRSTGEGWKHAHTPCLQPVPSRQTSTCRPRRPLPRRRIFTRVAHHSHRRGNSQAERRMLEAGPHTVTPASTLTADLHT